MTSLNLSYFLHILVEDSQIRMEMLTETRTTGTTPATPAALALQHCTTATDHTLTRTVGELYHLPTPTPTLTTPGTTTGVPGKF